MAGHFPFLRTFAKHVIAKRRLVIALWCLLDLGLVVFAPRFLQCMKLTFDPPHGSPSASDLGKFKEYMPKQADSAQFGGVITARSGSVLGLPGFGDLADGLHLDLNATGRLVTFWPTQQMVALSKQLNVTLPPMVLSADGSSMLFAWTTADPATSQDVMDWSVLANANFSARVDAWIQDNGLGEQVSFVGTMSLAEASAKAMEILQEDEEKMEAISLPIAAFVLFYTVQSGRLLILTLAALGTSAIISCSMLWFLSLRVSIQFITPPLMLGLLAAMSIDYSLFMLTRFREELLNVPDVLALLEADDAAALRDVVETAVGTAMASSGATILVSGFVLAASTGFLLGFPVAVIANIGVGCVFTMFILVLVNLTLVPAILSSFPQFFATSVSPDRRGARFWRCVCRKRGEDSSNGKSKIWTKLAQVTTTRPWNWLILLSVTAATLSLSYPILSMKITFDLKQNVAYESQTYEAIDHIQTDFGGGASFPYQVLLRPLDGSAVLSEDFFSRSSGFVAELGGSMVSRFPASKGSGFYFLSAINEGKGVPVAVPFDMLDKICIHAETPQNLCSFLNTMTNTDNYLLQPPTALTGMVVPSIDPLGKDGPEFLETFRGLLDELGSKYSMEAAVIGSGVYGCDMMTSSFTLFPLMIVLTLSAAFVFMAITFRSLVLPMRAIITNCLTLGFSYGLTVLVYQNGILDWVHWTSVSGKAMGYSIPWVVPVVMFFVVTGLGLDYDIFLSVRITEYRALGHDPQEAIRQGLVSTGGIITSAGVIMAITFGSMIFSSLLQLNMLGFMMFVAVLFDTFVARSLVNPSLMSLLGRANWWPGSLAAADLTEKMASCEPLKEP